MKKEVKSKEAALADTTLLDDACVDRTNAWEYPHIYVEVTLAILKPDVEAYHDDIESIILEKGFTIIDRRSIHMSEEQVLEFFGKKHDETYLRDLVHFYTRGLSRVLLLARKNALQRWLSIIGPEKYYRAREVAPESIRAIYGTDDLRNAVHGSENAECTRKEIAYFFPHKTVEPLLTEQSCTDFLARTVNRTLGQGLKALCYEKPKNPYSWLADWLLEHSPFKPDVNPVVFYVQ